MSVVKLDIFHFNTPKTGKDTLATVTIRSIFVKKTLDPRFSETVSISSAY